MIHYSVSTPKRMTFSRFLFLSAVLAALSSFCMFASTNLAAEAQNTTDSDEIEKLYEIANTFYDQHNFEEGVKYYDKILAINPSETIALNNKANLLADNQMYDEAFNYYDKILEINSSDILAINNKAFTLAEIGKNEQAYALAEKAVLDNPNDEYLQSTMAFILANLGNIDDAKKYYEKALKLNPNLVETLTIEEELAAFNKVMGNQTKIQ